MELAGNTGRDYILAFCVFIFSVIVLWIFRTAILRRIQKLTKLTKSELDDILVHVIEKVRWPFYVFLSLYFATKFLPSIPSFVENTLHYAVIVVVVFYTVKALQGFVEYGKKKVIAERKKEEKVEDVGIINALGDVIKGLLWLVAVLFILANMGYDINAFIAGLGIGGLAIALALQNVLSDIFASISIYFDKPFKVGDFIIVGGDLGVVKKIGIKTTRIQHLQGQELVISNQELTNSRINNYGKMEKRRISFNFGVKYETPVEKMKKIPGIVKDTIEKMELATFDRAHFNQFGDFNLNFEAVYYLETADYNKFMDTQQAINLAILEAFEKEKIEFAYPTQTVYVNK
ncbi:mechanosensitive ion channel family protein [Candidatus Altiarchaeota archaeon]